MPDRPVRTPEVVPGLDYSTHDGFRIDGSVVQWWGAKSAAREGAKRIGWPMNSVWKVHTRFQRGWALHQTHGGFLTRAAYAELAAGGTGGYEITADSPADLGPEGERLARQERWT